MFCSLAVNSDAAILDPVPKPVKHNALSSSGFIESHQHYSAAPVDFLLLIFSAAIIPAHFQARHSWRINRRGAFRNLSGSLKETRCFAPYADCEGI